MTGILLARASVLVTQVPQTGRSLTSSPRSWSAVRHFPVVAAGLFGTLLGVLVITLMFGNGLVLLGINSFFQQVVRGVIIVVAVLANMSC